MGKIYKCKNCNYSTLNEMEFVRHLNDVEFSCKAQIVTNDDYIKKKKVHLNKLIGEYRDLFRKLDAYRFCDVKTIDMDKVKEIYLFLDFTLNRIQSKIIDLKDNINPKHLDRLKESRENLCNAYFHISNRFMEEELKEVNRLDEKIREYHELRRIEKFNSIKRVKQHEVLKLTVDNINKFQEYDSDSDAGSNMDQAIETASSLLSSRTAFILELRDRRNQYVKERLEGKQVSRLANIGFDNTPVDTRF